MGEYVRKSYLRKMAMFEPQYTMDTGKDAETLLRLIEDAPFFDAVPVVRCKDCKYAIPQTDFPGEIVCENWDFTAEDENGFCYHGERSADND